MSHLQFLSSTTLNGRACGSTGLSEAAAYVRDALTRYQFAGANSRTGGDPYFQPFTVGSTLSAKNVVALCPSVRSSREYVLAMAHLDGMVAATPAAGWSAADDNGSGSAVLLASVPELSRLCKAGEIKRGVLLVWTDAEELGQAGAWYLRLHALPGIPVAAIKAVINLDQVGRGSPRSLLINDSDQKGVHTFLHEIEQRVRYEYPQLFDFLNHGLESDRRNQDGVAFSDGPPRDEQIPVLVVSEGHVIDGSPVRGHHTPGDDISSILRDGGDDKMRRLSELLVRLVREIANSP